MVLDLFGHFLVPILVRDSFTSEPAGFMWCMNPDCLVTFWDQIFAKKHPMTFDDRNRLGAEVQFVILVGLDESWKVDMVLCPECVVRKV